jgi:hypothetical protein
MASSAQVGPSAPKYHSGLRKLASQSSLVNRFLALSHFEQAQVTCRDAQKKSKPCWTHCSCPRTSTRSQSRPAFAVIYSAPRRLTNIAVQEGAAASLPRAVIRSRNATGRVTETLPMSETAHKKSATIRRVLQSELAIWPFLSVPLCVAARFPRRCRGDRVLPNQLAILVRGCGGGRGRGHRTRGSTLAVEVVARALEIEYQARSDLISFYKFDSRGLSHTMSDHKDFVHLPALRRPCGATVDPQRVPAEWCELRNRNTSPHPQEHDL